MVALRDENGDGGSRSKNFSATAAAPGCAAQRLFLRGQSGIGGALEDDPGQLKPAGPPEVVVEDLPTEHEHHDKGIAFDGKGSL